jgi:putative membrane protein
MRIMRLGMYHGRPGLFAILLLTLFVAMVVVGIVAIVTSTRSSRRHVPASGPGMAPFMTPVDPAATELRIRYARGELTRDEYLQRAHDLGIAPGPPPPGPPGGT